MSKVIMPCHQLLTASLLPCGCDYLQVRTERVTRCLLTVYTNADEKLTLPPSSNVEKNSKVQDPALSYGAVEEAIATIELHALPLKLTGHAVM